MVLLNNPKVQVRAVGFINLFCLENSFCYHCFVFLEFLVFIGFRFHESPHPHGYTGKSFLHQPANPTGNSTSNTRCVLCERFVRASVHTRFSSVTSYKRY